MAIQTAERVSFTDKSDSVIYFRHLIAYEETGKRISGNVLEIGCGEGYGIKLLAPVSTAYTALDKHIPDIDLKGEGNIEFRQLTVPPLTGFADNTFDFVVTFQVIEHIKNDQLFVSEIYRVLKPGGRLLLTTPNIKMSLTRNPWHIREYNKESMRAIFEKNGFSKVDVKGIYGDEKVMDYYEENRRSVRKFTRFDIFNLQYILPRFLLQIPYDIANRMNRKSLLNGNEQLVEEIGPESFFIREVSDTCFDFYCIAEK